MKRVAVAQAPSLPGRVGENVGRAVELIGMAADAGAVLVLLPELFLSGYEPEAIAADPASHVIKTDDAECGRLRSACAARGVAAVVGAAVACGGGVANAALVLAPDGALLHVYRKVKLWGEEARAFVAGDSPVVVDLAGLKVGLAICFDAGFPEHARALALAGAEVIACPSAFAEGEERHRYELYFPVRALENTLYVAVSNAVGRQGGLEMFGDSVLFSPRGHEIARIGREVGIETAEIDPAEIAAARRELPYLANLPKSPIDVPIIEWR
jgi:predicted amidohydrolase